MVVMVGGGAVVTVLLPVVVFVRIWVSIRMSISNEWMWHNGGKSDVHMGIVGGNGGKSDVHTGKCGEWRERQQCPIEH